MILVFRASSICPVKFGSYTYMMVPVVHGFFGRQARLTYFAFCTEGDVVYNRFYPHGSQPFLFCYGPDGTTPARSGRARLHHPQASPKSWRRCSAPRWKTFLRCRNGCTRLCGLRQHRWLLYIAGHFSHVPHPSPNCSRSIFTDLYGLGQMHNCLCTRVALINFYDIVPPQLWLVRPRGH